MKSLLCSAVAILLVLSAAANAQMLTKAQSKMVPEQFCEIHCSNGICVDGPCHSERLRWFCPNKKDILLHSDDGEEHWCLSPVTANSNPQGMQKCVESITVGDQEFSGKIKFEGSWGSDGSVNIRGDQTSEGTLLRFLLMLPSKPTSESTQ